MSREEKKEGIRKKEGKEERRLEGRIRKGERKESKKKGRKENDILFPKNGHNSEAFLVGNFQSSFSRMETLFITSILI